MCLRLWARPEIESEPAALEIHMPKCHYTVFYRQNTAANDTFLCWVLEFLNTGASGLIAAFGNASCYLSVTSDNDLCLL